MICLLFPLFLSVNQVNAGASYEIPAYMHKVRAQWADLNNDGLTDIWVSGSDQNLWYLDGANPEAGFQQLPYDQIDAQVRPAFINGSWCASTWTRGMFLVFDQKWQVIPDASAHRQVRQGLAPISSRGYNLIPTFDGYVLVDEVCPIQEFQVTPSVLVKSSVLELTWPVPELRDLDKDGDLDLVSPPVLFPQHGEVRIWSAFNEKGQWESRTSIMEMPANLEIVRWKTGDLNGDGFDELVILASPTRDMSLFDELSFIIWQGSAKGQWERAPLQILKTNQNLWQEGPIEISQKGILFYYYKGLIRSHFSMDLYRWNAAGFVEPKPQTTRWKMEDASRGVILTDYDWNDDGLADLVLFDEKGYWAYIRNENDKLPFSENHKKNLGKYNRGDSTISVSIGTQDSKITSSDVGFNIARGNDSIAIVGENLQPQIWHLSELDSGSWKLERLM